MPISTGAGARSLARDERGAVAVIAAIAILPLLLAMGLAVDLTRAYMVRAKLLAALDAAGLAAGANPSLPSDQAAAIAQKYLAQNFPDGSSVDVSAASVSSNSTSLSVSATATLRTGFLGLMGVNALPVSATSTIDFPMSLEVAMVLDNTGSLAYPTNNAHKTNPGDNIVALKTASGQFLLDLFKATPSLSKIRIGVVPYVAAVNPGPVAASMVKSPPKLITYDPTTGAATDPADWAGCVVERSSTFAKVTAAAIAADLDTPVSAGANNYLTPYIWPSTWFSGSSLNWTTKTINAGPYSDGYTAVGPNQSCPTPVVPLTNDKAALFAAIGADPTTGQAIINSGMEQWQNGGTDGAIGMAWGYRMLSPDGPYAAAGQQVSPWNDEIWRKAVVLMTDGVNAIHQNNGKNDYTGDPSTKATSTVTPSANTIDKEEEAICDALRSRGVVIYSVFLNSNSSPGPAIEYCAGATAGKEDPNYFYNAQNQTQLYAAFANIANSLNNLRIAK